MDETPVDTTVTKTRNVGSAPKGSRNALKHGLYAYKRMLDGGDLDQRSSLYNALRQKEEELVSALGGDPSPQERVIINDTIRVLLYVGSLDEYLMTLKNLIRKARPHPVLAVRTQLAAHIRENLRTLGLKRQQKQVDGWDAIREKYHANSDGKEDSDEP